MPTKTILLHNATLVTLDERGPTSERQEVLIEEGKITQIGGRLNTNRIPVDTRIDCSGKIVMPGLVNAHSHLLEILQRSFRDNVRKEVWLRHRQITEEAVQLSPRQIGAAAALACAEMLKSGVTSVVDHFSLRSGMTTAAMRATVSAFEKTGIRGTIAPSLRDQNFLELVTAGRRGKKTTTGADSDLWKARMLPILGQLGNSSTRSNLMLGPSSPQNCSDSLLRDVMIMAERYDLGIHTHLLETIVERWGGGKLYKGGIVRRIDKLGLLSPRLSVAHGVWLDAKEMDLLARSGASVVHNPASNLKLGSGIAPVTKLIRRGVNVALGTDGGDTSDSYSIFEQMRLAAFLSRLNNENADHWLTASDVLRMGTLNGANAIPAWRGKIGRIKTGYRADLVILRPHLGLYPVNDVIHQLVYCESGRSVDTVLVDGNVVVKNGRLVSASEKTLIEEVKPISNTMYKTYTRSKRAAEETDTVIQGLYLRARRANLKGRGFLA